MIQNKTVTVFTQLWLQSQVPKETSKHLSDWGASASKQRKGAQKVPLISTEATQMKKKVGLA